MKNCSNNCSNRKSNVNLLKVEEGILPPKREIRVIQNSIKKTNKHVEVVKG